MGILSLKQKNLDSRLFGLKTNREEVSGKTEEYNF